MTLHFTKHSDNSPLIGYHVTEENHLPAIKRRGILPMAPEDYDDFEGVYLFKSLEDVQEALMNWLGDRIEDAEEKSGISYNEIVLEVNLSGLEEYLLDSVEYEWVCFVPIEPHRIIRTIKM